MGKLVVLNHPLIDRKMAEIRDKNTSTKALENVGKWCINYRLTKDLETIEVEVETPIQKTKVNN